MLNIREFGVREVRMGTDKVTVPQIARTCLLLTILVAAPHRLQGGGVQESVSKQQAETASPSLAGIAHIALRVHDLAASTTFYEKLGFVRAFALSRNGDVYEAFIKVNDHQFIELYPVTEKDPQVGFLHICFEASHIQAVHDFYVAQGMAPIDVRKAGAGNLLFTMPGPATLSGPQNIEYTQYMPGSMHSNDVGQHLGESRIADEITSVTLRVLDPPAALSLYKDKLRFSIMTGAAKRLAIPGAPGESIQINSSEAQGLKAQFTLKTSGTNPAELLMKRGVAFSKEKAALTLLDPDGNGILLEPR